MVTRNILVIAGLLGLTLSGCERATEVTTTAPILGFDPADLHNEVRPQDDFFAYVNAIWIANTPIPPEWSRYGVSTIVYERTEAQVRSLIEVAAANAESPDDARIGALFASFMNRAQIEAVGLTGLAASMSEIDAINSHDGVVDHFARLWALNVDGPVRLLNDADASTPERTIAYFWQGGLGLPDRDYYLKDDAKFTEIQQAYRTHIKNMAGLAGWSEQTKIAETIYRIEHHLAKIQWSGVQNRDRERIYGNRFTFDAARDNDPMWGRLVRAGNLGEIEYLVIAQDDYFESLPGFVRDTSVADWRIYLKWKLLKSFARLLPEAIVTENFDFEGRVLHGRESQRPRWKRGVALTNTLVGELVGKLYVERHFPPTAKAKIREMVENLRKAFSRSIDELTWMSDATKAAAQVKLAGFTGKLGYPDKWIDYSTLHFDPEDLIDNVFKARAFEYLREIEKLHKPTDRSEWGMSPQTVNAYYRATFNEIVFPAAILQAPYFDPRMDDAHNYGAIGSVIGHEFSHGFDDQGRKFDASGRLRDWWTPDDAEQYEARAGRLVDQYARFQPLADLNINGELTLGENIGDLAGVIMAYRAYRISLGGVETPDIDGFSGAQRFFIGFATGWRGHSRDESLREQLLSDPHSPARYRVMGVLPNISEFHDAFATKPGDGMYLAEEERVKIW
ncbi:MAG: M13 family metallopeptidase [Gammaproteobacteria bacterium]|nr:M13 family metallopeptidase [Gammaproteobacteria bacterium]